MNILVIGDWTIDRNWICGVQRSSLSSRTGRMHLRGLNEKDGATEALCGAGATASVLYRALENDISLDYNITGFGIWHIQDTDILTDMIFPADCRVLQPSGRYSRFAPMQDNKKESVRLVNLADDSQFKKYAGTTSIVRIYQHTGSKVDLLSRIDWESPLPAQKKYWISSQIDATSAIDRLKQFKPFNAVVVKCISKGVVSPALIKKLSTDRDISKLPWYISTKDWKPEWFNDITRVNCRMLLIPQMAVDAAKLRKDTTKWINSKGYGTQNALKEIEVIRSSFKKNTSEKPVVIVLPSGHRILAVGPGKIQEDNKVSRQRDCDDLLIVQNERETFTKPMPIETPFASIFLGAFIVQDLEYLKNNKKKEPNKPDTKEVLEKALLMTRAYVKSENSRVLNPEEWDPQKDEIRFNLSGAEKLDGKFDWKHSITLKKALNRWDHATKKLGIIKRQEGIPTLELFRAATEVDDYICIDPDKRNALQRLIIELKKFRDSARERSCSCKIIAPPGTGKTRLAQRLALAEGYNFLQFNLTHLYSREQILDIFDRISTEQAKKPEAPLLVFIDEINTELNQSCFYSSFLTPLEDGIYVRAEKIFHIEPCFWLFAGTKTNDDSKSGSTSQSGNKWSDLRSRLTLPNINLDETKQDIKRLETVYIGVSMLVATFPDVRWVSIKILTLFWLLGGIKDLRMRQLVQFIRSFFDIQRGRVTSANVNIDSLKTQDIGWSKLEEESVWMAAKDSNIIKEIPISQNKTNSARWVDLPEGEDIKIEL
jgi:hypothetical protein